MSAVALEWLMVVVSELGAQLQLAVCAGVVRAFGYSGMSVLMLVAEHERAS